MNLANLFEPLTVDDVCHHYYAAQVAEHPLAPFEFETVWHQKPVPAWEVMVAPVNSYYWAPAIALFWESPLAWRLWFLPLQWLFCWSLLRLLHRFVPRHAAWLLPAVALGPSVLPGVNFMLEVPMQAFAFAGLASFLTACDKRSLAVSLWAGVLWGIAFQTKYSAMGFFGPWVLFALVRCRWREWAVGFAAAVATALTIEGLLSLSHGGGSYFLQQLTITQRRDWPHILRGMFLHVGGLGIPAVLLALHALLAPRWLRWSVLGSYALGLTVVALVPNRDARSLADMAWDSIAYLVMATLTWSCAVVLLGRLLMSVLPRLRQLPRPLGRGAGLRVVLVGWFCSEIGASLVMSPFPAARRSMLVVIAFTVAAAWLLARRRAGGTTAWRWFTAVSVALGLGFQGVDTLDGQAVVEAARQAVAHVRAQAKEARIWFTGGWGFEFYAPRAGMQPLLRQRSEVAAGDYIVVGSIDGAETPWFDWNCPVWLQRVDQKPHEIGVGDAVPFSLAFGYYSGRRPLDGQSGPRFVVWVYRVVAGFQTSELKALPNPWRDQ